MASPSNPPTPPPPDETPGDEQLSAWLDAELPADEMARIEAWLQAHPDQAARVRLWAADRQALQARLGHIADEPVPQAWRELVLRGQRRRPPLPLAWAAGLLLAGGVIGGLVAAGIIGASGRSGEAAMAHAPSDRPARVTEALALPARPSERPTRLATDGPQAAAAALAPWLHRAAVAHAVYVPERRHPVEVPVDVGDPAQQAAQAQHLARWLSKRLDMPVRLYDLSSLGFALMGGRLLPDAVAPSAQLMYQDADGHRVTLYLRRPEAGSDTAFAFGREGALGLFYWSEQAYGCAVVGDLPRDRLLAVAQTVYQQYEADEAARAQDQGGHQPAPTAKPGMTQPSAPTQPAPAAPATRPMS